MAKARKKTVQVMADGDIMSAPLLDISASGARIAAPAPARGARSSGSSSKTSVRFPHALYALQAMRLMSTFVNADRYRDAQLRKVYEQRPAQVRASLIFKALAARALP
jgi:hypothetical protein